MPTKAFILNHRSDDPLTLALQAAKHPDVDMAYALEQISGWQRAKEKLPSWAACDDIIYPGRLALEQCSSEQTARHKADICQRLLSKHTQVPTIMADLTGGMGVDFSHLAPLFTKAFYIEQQQQLCLLARNNFKAIHISNAEVLEGDGIALLHQLPHLTLAYLDPARRDTHGARTFAIADCTPNIIEHLDTLLEKADMLMVKLSPMLDIAEAERQLKGIREIHIVSVNGECKETLFVLQKEAKTSDEFAENHGKNQVDCGQHRETLHGRHRDYIENPDEKTPEKTLRSHIHAHGDLAQNAPKDHKKERHQQEHGHLKRPAESRHLQHQDPSTHTNLQASRVCSPSKR